jgi:hypothetical protein
LPLPAARGIPITLHHPCRLAGPVSVCSWVPAFVTDRVTGSPAWVCTCTVGGSKRHSVAVTTRRDGAVAAATAAAAARTGGGVGELAVDARSDLPALTRLERISRDPEEPDAIVFARFARVPLAIRWGEEAEEATGERWQPLLHGQTRKISSTNTPTTAAAKASSAAIVATRKFPFLVTVMRELAMIWLARSTWLGWRAGS